WPRCNGEWFPPLAGLVAIHMAHRFGAYLLALWLGAVAWRSRALPDAHVRRAGAALLALVLVQGVVGVVNLLLGIRVWLSALHLAIAAGMLALALATAFRLALEGAPVSAFAR